MEEKKYPGMTVEARDVNNTHGLKPPTQIGTDYYKEQLQDTIKLASSNNPDDVLSILKKYSPVPTTKKEIENVFNELNWTWQKVCNFVRADECIEFFTLIKKYTEAKGFKLKKDKGFIDGNCVGLYENCLGAIERTLQKVFDAKYTFKQTRPLEDLKEQTGVDFSYIANYLHPGHFRYPAGHAGIFYESGDHIFRNYDVSPAFRTKIILIAYIFAMGRSGILVHLPEDNIAAGALAGLKEFDNWLVD